MFGHRRSVGTRRIDDKDSALGGGMHVDLVRACGADEDDLEQHRTLEHLGGHRHVPTRSHRMQRMDLAEIPLQRHLDRLVPWRETVGAPEPDGTLGLVEAVDHFDVLGALQQRVSVRVEQECRNENLLAQRHAHAPSAFDIDRRSLRTAPSVAMPARI